MVEAVKLPAGVGWHASPFAIEARCTECRWHNVSGDPRESAIAHTLERGHDTTVSMIGHIFYEKLPTPEGVTP